MYQTTYKYTVLLLYPAYMTDGDIETYLAHVNATTKDEAITNACKECKKLNRNKIEKLEDLIVLAVFMGHHDDYKYPI